VENQHARDSLLYNIIDSLNDNFPCLYSISIIYSSGISSGVWYNPNPRSSVPFLVGAFDSTTVDGFTFYQMTTNGSYWRDTSSVVKTKGSYDPSQEDWFHKAYVSGDLIITSPQAYQDDPRQTVVITAAKSLWVNGEFQAVVAAAIDLKSLSISLEQLSNSTVLKSKSWAMDNDIMIASTSGPIPFSYADSFNVLSAEDSSDTTISTAVTYAKTYYGDSWHNLSSTLMRLERKYDDPVTYLNSVTRSTAGVYWTIVHAFDYSTVYDYMDTSEETLLILWFSIGVSDYDGNLNFSDDLSQ
jgi:hypothetical protein